MSNQGERKRKAGLALVSVLMPLDGSHADMQIQVHKEDGRNPFAQHAKLLIRFLFSVLFVLSGLFFWVLGMGGGGHPWRQEIDLHLNT